MSILLSTTVKIAHAVIKDNYPHIVEDEAHSKAELTSIASPTPNLSKGDLAFPMFFLAKKLKKSPAQIAAEIASAAEKARETKADSFMFLERAEAHGPYVNFFLCRKKIIPRMIQEILQKKAHYGSSHALKNKRIMVEFSAPNTNKPLHIGHLRNDVLGECISRVLSFAGAEVCRVNLVNDRGIHICKSMLAYQHYGSKKTPESAGKKPDHFVGDYYVKYNEWVKKDASVEAEVNSLLRKWEENDADTRQLWKQMNDWALEGILQTYEKTGIHFDKIYFESNTYELGKKKILEAYKKDLFYKDSKGAIKASLKDINLDEKVLLRSDGTSLYITQDIGTAMLRFEDWNFDTAIYVVANEQIYHFRVLFYLLKVLGFKPALENAMHHLHYGMVNLPEGKMKSREGTVIDADDLIEETTNLVKEEIQKRERSRELDNLETTAQNIAIGAIHYYLLHVNAKKDMLFLPASSISFQGNTGPYLQYSCARIASMLRKYSENAGAELHTEEVESTELLTEDSEWKLIMQLDIFSKAIETVTEKHDPSILTKYLYDLASEFAHYYHSVPIIREPEPALQKARAQLCRAVLQVLRTGLRLLVVPYIDKM